MYLCVWHENLGQRSNRSHLSYSTNKLILPQTVLCGYMCCCSENNWLGNDGSLHLVFEYLCLCVFTKQNVYLVC